MIEANPEYPIYLDRNESNHGPAPKCYEVLKTVDFQRFSWYTRAHEKNYKGDLSLRLAKEYSLEEKNIVLGYGGEDLLKQIVHCYLREGETLFVPAFSWWYYKSIASEVGGKTMEFPLYAGDDSYHYDVDGLIEMYKKHKPKIILISTPNNPTGNTLDEDELKRILKETAESIIVLDEAYAMFKTTDLTYVTNIINQFPNVCVIRTFSKYYGLAGVRIGYAVIGSGLDQFEKFSSRYLGYDRINELIALAALDSADYYEKIGEEMNRDRELFYEEFSRLPGFKPYKSDANFMLIDMQKEQMSPLDKYLKERGLVIKFMSEEVLNSQVRITFGTHEQNMLLLKTINQYVKNNS